MVAVGVIETNAAVGLKSGGYLILLKTFLYGNFGSIELPVCHGNGRECE